MFQKTLILGVAILTLSFLVLVLSTSTVYANPIVVPANWSAEKWIYTLFFNSWLNCTIGMVAFYAIHAINKKNVIRLLLTILFVTCVGIGVNALLVRGEPSHWPPAPLVVASVAIVEVVLLSAFFSRRLSTVRAMLVSCSIVAVSTLVGFLLEKILDPLWWPPLYQW
ncbi:hypothetical protein ACFLXE_05510 [Chloroflexota bacterium]